jgi:hypothetical protein
VSDVCITAALYRKLKKEGKTDERHPTRGKEEPKDG